MRVILPDVAVNQRRQPIFAKRHYEWLASWLRHEHEEYPQTTKWLIERLADKLQQENSAFNRQKFLAACGLK